MTSNVISFLKLNGCGNDFIMINGLDEKIELTPSQIASLCDRHFGIGADGVIIVDKPMSEGCVAFMNYYNSDGTTAQMCGNGIRCFTKYLLDYKIVDADKQNILVDTRAGVRKISFELDANNKMTLATVNMGNPILEPEKVPVSVAPNSCTEGGESFAKEIVLSGGDVSFPFTFVSMGNPHSICFLDDIASLDDNLFSDKNNKSLETFKIDEIGSVFESHEIFPEKSNIEFAVVEKDIIKMRVFERGCGETLACGTGACATNVAACLTGRARRHNVIQLLGGKLEIDWLENGDVMMTGPAEESFRGTFSI